MTEQFSDGREKVLSRGWCIAVAGPEKAPGSLLFQLTLRSGIPGDAIVQLRRAPEHAARQEPRSAWS